MVEEIFQAATDNSDRVHYQVTEQARRMIGYRREIDDEAWLQQALRALT